MNLITSALVFVLGLIGVAAAGFSLVPGGSLHPLYALPFFAAAVFVGMSLKMANTWEKFVILRAGKLQGVRGPGMFLMIPIIDQVIAVIDERIQTTAFNAE
jgi:hypothetical protein